MLIALALLAVSASTVTAPLPTISEPCWFCAEVGGAAATVRRPLFRPVRILAVFGLAAGLLRPTRIRSCSDWLVDRLSRRCRAGGRARRRSRHRPFWRANRVAARIGGVPSRIHRIHAHGAAPGPVRLASAARARAGGR